MLPLFVSINRIGSFSRARTFTKAPFNEAFWSKTEAELALVTQMDQRVRPTLPIERRASGSPETHPLVKADSLVVLFVDVGRHCGVKR